MTQRTIAIKQHDITVTRTAHYYSLGENISDAEFVWFVFHGYGQLASRIIKKFNRLDLEKNFVIAPEGLSRFYWGGVSGEVVASWMTSLDRLSEIQDYLLMIDQIYEKFKTRYKGKKLIFLGFSQGSATAWRWIAGRKPDLHAYIQWAGGFPPEINYPSLKSYLSTFQQMFVYGDKDEYLNDERMKEFHQFIQENFEYVRVLPFKGGHNIDRTHLQYVLDIIS